MQDYRQNEPMTYVANGLRFDSRSQSIDSGLTSFDDIAYDQGSSTWSFPVFLRDENFNEIDYVNWRIGNYTAGTNLSSKFRIAFGLALAPPFEEPTLYEYTMAGYTDSMIELIPFVAQLFGGGSALTRVADGAIHVWNGSQDLSNNDDLPFNFVEYQLLPFEQSRGLAMSSEGLIAMHESYGPSWEHGYYVNNAVSNNQGSRNSPVIIGVIAFNDQGSAQNMKNTDISISGRRVPHSETANLKDRRPL